MPGDAEEGIEVEMLPLVLSLAPCGEAGCFIRDTEVVLSFDISLLGGLPVPTNGLGIVAFHTSTVLIRDTGIELSVYMSLLGRFPVPPRGLGMVKLHPLTVFIHDTEVALSAGISLLGDLPVQPHGLGMALLHLLTACIRDTEIELSVDMSLLGRLLVPSHGLGMAAQPTQPRLLEQRSRPIHSCPACCLLLAACGKAHLECRLTEEEHWTLVALCSVYLACVSFGKSRGHAGTRHRLIGVGGSV